MQSFLAHVVLDQQIQFCFLQRIEPCRCHLGIEGFGTELNKGQQRIAIDDDSLAVEIAVLGRDEVEKHEQADAYRQEMHQGLAQELLQNASPTPK